MTDQTTAVAAQTPEERIAQDVAKFSPAAAKLERFRDFKTIVVNGLADKDGLKICFSARQEVKNERVALDKLRLSLGDDARTYIKAVNAGAKPYIEEMEAIEAHLQAEEDKIEALAEEERTKAAREREKMIENRKQELFAMGFTWDGNKFVAGFGVNITEQELVTATQDEFVSTIGTAVIVKNEWMEKQEALARAKAEADRIAEENAAKVRAQEEENERKAQELAAKEEAIRKEQEEKALALVERERKLNEQIDQSRANELVAIGMYRKPDGANVYLTEDGLGYTYPVNQLHGLENWDSVVAEMRVEVKDRDARIEAARIASERQAILEGRVKELRAVGYTSITELQLGIVADGKQVITSMDELADLEPDLYAELFGIGEVEMGRRKLAEQEQLRKEGEQRERDRIAKEQAEEEVRRVQVAAKLSDFEKFTEWTSNILLTKPELTSEIGKHAVERLCDHVKDMTFGVGKDLK